MLSTNALRQRLLRLNNVDSGACRKLQHASGNVAVAVPITIGQAIEQGVACAVPTQEATLKAESLALHEKNQGKLAVSLKVPLRDMDDLARAYSPGVAEPCRQIHADPPAVYRYTAKGNLVAVVTDGSAVLGLGNIGPEAAMPVMEGKAA